MQQDGVALIDPDTQRCQGYGRILVSARRDEVRGYFRVMPGDAN